MPAAPELIANHPKICQPQTRPKLIESAPAVAKTALETFGFWLNLANGQPTSPEIQAILTTEPRPKSPKKVRRAKVVGSSAATKAVSAPLPAKPWSIPT